MTDTRDSIKQAVANDLAGYRIGEFPPFTFGAEERLAKAEAEAKVQGREVDRLTREILEMFAVSDRLTLAVRELAEELGVGTPGWWRLIALVDKARDIDGKRRLLSWAEDSEARDALLEALRQPHPPIREARHKFKHAAP